MAPASGRYGDAVLVLLPPLESKRGGGDGPPPTTAALSFPELDQLRKELVDELVERPDGARSVVSHHNKAHKSRLARALAVTRAEPADAAGVAAVVRRAGMRVERRGTHLDVVVPA